MKNAYRIYEVSLNKPVIDIMGVPKTGEKGKGAESLFKRNGGCSTWVAQSVKRSSLVQVMISVCGFEPHVRLCTDSSEPGTPASDSVSPFLSDPPPLALCISKINKHFKKLKKRKEKKRKEIVAENLPNLDREMDIQIHET